MTLPAGIEVVSIWITTGLWIFISFFALVDALIEMRDEYEDALFASRYGSEKLIYIAVKRARQAKWFAAGFGASSVVGLLAGINLLLAPPTLDASILTAFLRALLIFTVFAFWRCKRLTRQIRKGFYQMLTQAHEGEE